MRRLAAVALAALGTAGLLAQTQQPPATFRSGIDVVKVDVSVLDKDRRPIHGLTAADFTVVVDGAPQPIVAFEEVVLPPRPVPTAAWMRDVAPDVKTNALGEPRLFLIVMDDMRTPMDSYMVNSAKSVARAIVDELLPSDLAAVVFTKNNRGAQELTSDRALLLTAIETFRPGWAPELAELSTAMSTGTLREAIKVLGPAPTGAERDHVDQRRRGNRGAAERHAEVRDGGRRLGGTDLLARSEREARLAERLGIDAIADASRVARIPIYAFGIAGLQASNTALDNRNAPKELQSRASPIGRRSWAASASWSSRTPRRPRRRRRQRTRADCAGHFRGEQFLLPARVSRELRHRRREDRGGCSSA